MTPETTFRLEKARKAREIRKDLLALKRRRKIRTPEKNRKLRKDILIQKNLLSQTVNKNTTNASKPSHKRAINGCSRDDESL
ncbi:hypothetical protein MKW98_002736 [Papaver atlanticum]|uniref:Uncharacterized protein n=1 Tax=Papaver atlanticum TaxID=357466 RepID=A0AAD4SBZ0_9MAGN|nr:hypothetical protein MKW98_002736 [Papaver atlanticum]